MTGTMHPHHWVVIAATLLIATSPAWAQDSGPGSDAEFARLSDKIKAGESVVITTQDGRKVEGRFVDVSLARIAVRRDDEQQELPAPQVARVQVRRNGLLLGPLIGAIAGVPFGAALGSYQSNEGGSAAVAIAMAVGIGAGAGLAIDAALVRPRTVFERKGPSRSALSLVVTPKRTQAEVRIRF